MLSNNAGTVEFMTQLQWCFATAPRSGFVMEEEIHLEGRAFFQSFLYSILFCVYTLKYKILCLSTEHVNNQILENVQQLID